MPDESTMLNEELDVNLSGADGKGILDRALNLYSLYLARPEWSFDGALALLSKKLVEELLERGAELHSEN